jgi:hypothetical protein
VAGNATRKIFWKISFPQETLRRGTDFQVRPSIADCCA